jgi:hypothetical protein
MFHLGGNTAGLEWLSCHKEDGGTFTYAEVAGHLFNITDRAIAMLEPLPVPTPNDSAWSLLPEPLTQIDAAATCSPPDHRLPTADEYEWLAEELAGLVSPGECLWTQEWLAENRAKLARTDGQGFTFEGAPADEAACRAICARGLMSVLDWGVHRETIETVFRHKGFPSFDVPQPQPDTYVVGGERLIQAERVLKNERGLERVVRAVIDDPLQRIGFRTFHLDIDYADGAGDRCARVNVEVLTDGWRFSVKGVTTEIDTPCPTE